jgi:hypothetical protein
MRRVTLGIIVAAPVLRAICTPAFASYWPIYCLTAISGDLLSAVISIRYILGFRKDNPNVFNMLVQDLPIASGIKCICC